jgi:hypothetical protein
VEVSRAAHVERSALGASAREKVASVSVPVGVAGADATSCANGGHVNLAKHWPKDSPGKVTLAPMSPMGSGLNPP